MEITVRTTDIPSHAFFGDWPDGWIKLHDNLQEAVRISLEIPAHIKEEYGDTLPTVLERVKGARRTTLAQDDAGVAGLLGQPRGVGEEA